MLTRVPQYRIAARHPSIHSSNQLHDDAIARRLGFRANPVPGVTIYAYLTRPLLVALGDEWLERGIASVRFVQPVYEGEEIRLQAAPAPGAAAALEVRALDPAGDACAILTAGLASDPGPPRPEPAEYPRGALPAEPPPATAATLQALAALGSPERLYDEAAAARYCADFDEGDLRYRGAGGVVHPAFFLDQGNRALDQNVRLGPWIHTGSEVRHLGLARVGQRIVTRGRVRRVFERRGHRLVELDLLLVADDARPVAHLRHTAIYRPRAAPSDD